MKTEERRIEITPDFAARIDAAGRRLLAAQQEQQALLEIGLSAMGITAGEVLRLDAADPAAPALILRIPSTESD